MLRNHLAKLVNAAVDRLISDGRLPAAVRDVPVEIIDTRQPEHGDFACNFAMTATKRAGMAPRQIGEMLREELLSPTRGASGEAGRGVEESEAHEMTSEGDPITTDVFNPFVDIEVAGPGFVNFRLKPTYVSSFLAQSSGKSKASRGEHLKINVEFVSVNPNGPITVGSGRGAAFGDTLCRVLSAAGEEVFREYYVNDGVNSEQMYWFATTLPHYWRVAHGIDSAFPEKGYRGEYVQQVAEQAADAFDLWEKALQQEIDQGKDSADPAELQRSADAERHLTAIRSIDRTTKSVREVLAPDLDTVSIKAFQRVSQDLMVLRQQEDLSLFGVSFDTWFSEQSLHDAGEVEKCVQSLIDKGLADEEAYRTKVKYDRQGKIVEAQREEQASEDDDDPQDAISTEADSEGRTLWLRSTKFGDDMDRVLRRRDGRLTYIASDVAYHKDKFNRPKNAAKLLTILGPDHHGYIDRLHAVVAALFLKEGKLRVESAGLGEAEAQVYRSVAERDACRAALAESHEKLEIVIFQIVRFLKDGKPAPMRKRDGNIYELRDLIHELGSAAAPDATQDEQLRIGRDVARFFYLMRSHDTHMDFDIDLATSQSDDNPVFYAQYAHARICSVIEKAATTVGPSPEYRLLTHPRETALIKKLLDLDWEVCRCATDYGVHRLTTYAVELGRSFHHFYDACRVIQPEEPKLTEARLALCAAARDVLRRTFELLGVSAPKKMERTRSESS